MIRPYTDDDTDQVIDVFLAASRLAHPFLSEAFLAGERQQMIDSWLPNSDTIVSVIDGRVVGFLSLVDNEVGAIFVDPQHHRTGIGRALMDVARASRPMLNVEVFEANDLGRRFYASYGFMLVSQYPHDTTGQTMLRLRLD